MTPKTVGALLLVVLLLAPLALGGAAVPILFLEIPVAMAGVILVASPWTPDADRIFVPLRPHACVRGSRPPPRSPLA